MDPNAKFQVEVDPNEDTEWNDILRSHGIIPEKPKDPTDEIEEALSEAVAKQHENRLEGKTLDELDALEDEEDEDFLNSYKQKRLQQIRELASKSKFGSVLPISKPEYTKEVAESSKSNYVFLHMTLQSNLQSRKLSALMISLASKFPEIKFVEIPANRAVENYPDSNCPTILIYHKGDVVKQYITLTELGGNSTTLNDLEKVLVDVGAVVEKDKRLIMNAEEDEEDIENRSKIKFAKKSIRGGANENDDDDDDDDFFD
ncbi:hypothetical protein PACTADRAFT_66948 [Pachysolen tannophilus NRRL Y-2460]|uniref:Phosducin domain-containing protein n=1 Tax=Pachysolen tannophilus NRRL Y-2460 TaxID=669874 RepID=A0A1E4TW28_PACTA|nr:hypothetical protein PACTADRAFT_66948 [Pachysolen tannophilus NRRL Y-2460]